MKSKMANKENSVRGWKGVLKKLGYWLMIMVAFGASAIFIEIGKAIGVDLGITTLLGWFVLASLLINEIRSILENFVEAGFNVPIILIKGLEVADKVVIKMEIQRASDRPLFAPVQMPEEKEKNMSVQLLDKTRKINKLLHNNHSTKVVFNDICEVLMET